jgi:hypothetical protein
VMTGVKSAKESERISKRNMLNMLQSGGLEKGGEKNMESGEIEKSIECESEDTRAKRQVKRVREKIRVDRSRAQ